ncbi:MAG: tyrosine-type recombinase/integrase [Candidatus Heimdallarchaeota archaeon]|nr:MAG: tyrosine-type recombinase/integrase [Candidatus Heimdallarchaeota archaeon]
MNYPKPEYFDEFAMWLRTQGKSENTVNTYLSGLRQIPEDVETFFANPHLTGQRSKFAAYRSYLRFLAKKKKVFDRGDLIDALDSLKPRKKRGNSSSVKRWAIPRKEWEGFIRRAHSKVTKMGLWLGFHFGLRLSEILHLRVKDIDFSKQEINIQIHKKTKNQEAWWPKANRERQIPFTKSQGETLKRWIEQRPKELKHPYLLWTRGNQQHRKFKPLHPKTFQYWIRKIHPKLKCHVLRYSFATHYYNQSKDIKLISNLLGHANVATTSEYLALGHEETMSKGRALFAEGE